METNKTPKAIPTTFQGWVKQTFTWVDNDVKRYMQRAWAASTKARNELDKQEVKALKQQNEELIEQTAKLRADNTLLKEVNEAQAFTIDKYKADKDRLAEQLNMELGFLQSEYKSAYINKLFAVGSFMHNRITKITETLSECGY